ncbi:hypothetical protein B0A55_13664, partial [Friedmanniomyces simplex]
MPTAAAPLFQVPAWPHALSELFQQIRTHRTSSSDESELTAYDAHVAVAAHASAAQDPVAVSREPTRSLPSISPG